MFAKKLSSAIRKLSSHLVLSKRLPAEFGRARVLVTPRADLRLFYPGYDKAAFDLMLVARQYVREGQCVWDIGSNLGIFSACAASMAGPTGGVFSLEADPRYAALQNRSFRSLPTGFAPVRVLCAAAADQLSVMSFAVSRQGHARSHLAAVTGQQADESEQFQETLAVTLDFLLDYWPAPDFIKMDVEGAEALVLEGADRLLREIRPAFYIEVAGHNQRAASARFKTFGYDLFKIEADGTESLIDFCGLYTIARPRAVVPQQEHFARSSPWDDRLVGQAAGRRGR